MDTERTYHAEEVIQISYPLRQHVAAILSWTISVRESARGIAG